MTALSWDELVTCALLGSDRRPLPDDLQPRPATGPDDATLLLDVAARRRARAAADEPLPPCPAPEVAPPRTRRSAPAAARAVLTGLLVRPVPELVELWLAAAVEHGCGLAPGHWVRLADLAGRLSLDPARLATAYGARGRWFLRQNPQWHRLAGTLDAVADGTAPTGGPASPGEPRHPATVAAQVAQDPESVFTVPDPWPVAVTEVALAVVGRGQLSWATERFARRVGARMPLEQHEALQQAADRYLPAAADRFVRRGTGARQALLAADESLRARLDIHHAFGASPVLPTLPPLRVPGP